MRRGVQPVTARDVLDGIKALTERLDYVREWGSSDELHALANTHLKALHAAVDAVVALTNAAATGAFDNELELADTIRAAIENALEPSVTVTIAHMEGTEPFAYIKPKEPQ
jgi:hypothetical protein